ncbi:MAG: ABC transporter permease [Chloroflexi bacterium]|nr:MAG: ABC transporter permease [Chloroflexota bacterium]
MRDYILRRLILLIPIMFGVTFMTFLAYRIIPGDAAILKCQIECTPDTIKALRHEYGLDRPPFPISGDSSPPFIDFHRDNQFGDWLLDVARGDLGQSFSYRTKVTDELGRRIPITVELLIFTIVLALGIGMPIGVLSAIRPATPADWLARLISVLFLSVPSFYLGILLISFGSIWFGWTPPQFGTGYVPIYDDPWINVQQFFFPALVLAVGEAAVLMRLTRSSMLEVLRNDYIRTAWSKGLRERVVVWRHALKNAIIPIITVIGLQIGGLLGGAVIVESLYNLNGMGKYVLEAILRRDILVVQSVTLLFAVSYVVANLLVDLTYAWLDPRIRYA